MTEQGDRPHDTYCEWWGECWCNPDPYGETEKRERREAEARRVEAGSDTLESRVKLDG